jgi:hypothetical protein
MTSGCERAMAHAAAAVDEAAVDMARTVSRSSRRCHTTATSRCSQSLSSPFRCSPSIEFLDSFEFSLAPPTREREGDKWRRRWARDDKRLGCVAIVTCRFDSSPMRYLSPCDACDAGQVPSADSSCHSKYPKGFSKSLVCL